MAAAEDTATEESISSNTYNPTSPVIIAAKSFNKSPLYCPRITTAPAIAKRETDRVMNVNAILSATIVNVLATTLATKQTAISEPNATARFIISAFVSLPSRFSLFIKASQTPNLSPSDLT